jgi:hypothetical protein
MSGIRRLTLSLVSKKKKTRMNAAATRDGHTLLPLLRKTTHLLTLHKVLSRPC